MTTGLPLSLLCLAAAAGGVPVPGAKALDPDRVSEAIVDIRKALPPDWEMVQIRWDTLPYGWNGEPSCVLVRLEDMSIAFRHPTEDFLYHPFYKLWILPVCWEGRMAVGAIDERTPHALYLGEKESFRVLYRTLGRNTWTDGAEALGAALGLATFPLTHFPKHSLDVGAMQVLYQRLDTAGGSLERWQRQVYGIEELPRIIYLELLTWEDRPDRDAEDPTFLGELAELETRYLSREVLAAFPRKRGLYLRRVTEASFSDVLVVHPNCLSPSP